MTRGGGRYDLLLLVPANVVFSLIEVDIGLGRAVGKGMVRKAMSVCIMVTFIYCRQRMVRDVRYVITADVL